MRLGWMAATTSLLALAGCAEPSAYDRSIPRAAVYEPANVATLVPLRYPVHGATLSRRTEWAEKKVGETVSVTWDTWITVEPEVQGVCRSFPRDRVVDRLHQLLGLKPADDTDREKARFVRLRVDAPQATGPTGTGVFRPCGNPDPAATTCGNEFTGPPEYGAWFAKQTLGSYKTGPTSADLGYPWTHLGYTYNWDPAAASPRGPQEYVVPAGTTFTVVEVLTPAEYCARER